MDQFGLHSDCTGIVDQLSSFANTTWTPDGWLYLLVQLALLTFDGGANLLAALNTALLAPTPAGDSDPAGDAARVVHLHCA